MFDPMPQPRPPRFPPAIAQWRKEQRMLRIKLALVFVVSVVSLALIAAWALQYTGVMCNV